MKRVLILISFFISLTILGCRQGKAQENYVNVSPEKMQKLLLKTDKAQIIDVRTPEEYQAGHLMHAINIDFYSKSFSEDIKKLDVEKPVFIYCKSGRRSRSSTEQFKAAGFDKIYNLEGGYLGWIEQGHKISD
ncbi:rhodanese-like domain-containing protein [Gaetbulibacter saemankumensis]|uniref:rhodanese-like domain-containing protein n=1 Tax=Gaetbulibacter saemankumensis TaxID=311208 RepID=UPI000419A374|nr:rhodanese-like domain-containing protein [Gaetbulibacter saemankumensis]